MKIPTRLAPRFAYFCIKAYGFKSKKIDDENTLLRLEKKTRQVRHVIIGKAETEGVLISIKPEHPKRLLDIEADFKAYLKRAMTPMVEPKSFIESTNVKL